MKVLAHHLGVGSRVACPEKDVAEQRSLEEKHQGFRDLFIVHPDEEKARKDPEGGDKVVSPAL